MFFCDEKASIHLFCKACDYPVSPEFIQAFELHFTARISNVPLPQQPMRSALGLLYLLRLCPALPSDLPALTPSPLASDDQ
jgi:hypothetical protein